MPPILSHPTNIALQPPTTAYYVAFGAHGPRQAVNPPGHSIKILIGTLAACGAAVGIFGLIRSSGE
jgi:cytochrome c oxidase subunit 4